MEEANAKAEANNAELVEELGRYKEAYQELEQEAMVRLSGSLICKSLKLFSAYCSHLVHVNFTSLRDHSTIT